MTTIDPDLQDGRVGDPSRTDAALIRSEERLVVDTVRVPRGRAVLRRVIVTEQRTITVEVRHEEARLEFVPYEDADADERGDDAGAADAAPAPAERGPLPEVVLHEERIVVTRVAVPVERVRLRIEDVPGEASVVRAVRHEEIEASGDGLRA